MTRKKEKKNKPVPGETVLKNSKHELFCWLYAGYHNSRLFGNGTRSYMQAYGYNSEIDKINEKIQTLRNKKVMGQSTAGESSIAFFEARIKSMEHTANTEGNSLLARPNIRQRVDYLLEQYIDNEHTDKELQYVIMQRFDLQSKVAAIREFNRLKDRGSSGKLEGQFTFSWEGDEEEKSSTKRTKPVLKKAEIRQSSNVEWDDEE